MRVAIIVVGIVQPIAQAIYPYLCRSDHLRLRTIRGRVIRGGGLFVLIASVAIFVLSRDICRIVAGITSNELILLIRLSSAVVILTGLNVLLNPFIMALGRSTSMRKIYAWAAVVFLILCYPITRWLGSAGMMLCILVVESVVLIGVLRSTIITQ